MVQFWQQVPRAVQVWRGPKLGMKVVQFWQKLPGAVQVWRGAKLALKVVQFWQQVPGTVQVWRGGLGRRGFRAAVRELVQDAAEQGVDDSARAEG